MTREKVDLLVRNANELVTLRGSSSEPLKKGKMRDLGIIAKGAVAVNEGKIVAVDRTSRIEQRFQAEDVIDASGKAVMPGLIDSHAHLIFAGSREEEFELRVQGVSYLEVLAKGGGILQTVNETRRASKEELVKTAKRPLDTMLRHGTTTVEAKSGYGLSTKDETKCLEAAKELNNSHPSDIVSTFLGAHAVPPEFKSKTDEYVKLVTEEMIPRVAQSKLAEFCDVFCEEGAFSTQDSRSILTTSKRYGLRPKVHADEFTASGGAELAAEVNAISAEHLLFTTERGLKMMAEQEVVAVLLPAASFSLMTGKYADARKMIELGVPVALGTDFNPSCWTENMQMTIAFACREMRLTPAEAVVAATINAAHTMSRASEVGSLEEDKKADIIVLNAPNHRFLAYRFGVNLVDKVVKDGKIVVNNEEK